MQPLEIVVIGSGASGLAAAFRLQQAGHRVRILERGERIGSTLRSHRRDGYLLEPGAFLLASTHRRMLRIVEEAGMLDQVVPGKLIFGVPRNGTLHEVSSERTLRDLRRTRLISPAAKLRLLRLLPTLRRAGRELATESLPGTDNESAAAWARRTLGAEVSEYVVGPGVRALHATDPESCSRVELQAAINLLVGAGVIAFRDGMGAYPACLAPRFAVELRANATAVVERAGGVTVRWRDRTGRERSADVDAAVLAVPASAARELLPGLDPWRSAYLAAVREASAITVNVATTWAPPKIAATHVQIPASVHPFLGGVVFDHNLGPGRAPPDGGLLTLVALSEWSAEQADADDGAVGRALLNALEAVLPGALNDVRFLEVNRWSATHHPVGHYRGMARLQELCQGDTRIQLAGGYHGPRNLDSSTAAGERAARRLLAAVSFHRDGAASRAAAMRQRAGWHGSAAH
jgi:oxygen-dependent protoporphyrinogen oxidase